MPARDLEILGHRVILAIEAVFGRRQNQGNPGELLSEIFVKQGIDRSAAAFELFQGRQSLAVPVDELRSELRAVQPHQYAASQCQQ